MGEKGLFHYNDSGYKVDLSKQQEQLAEKAYIDGFDPENHDEYIVNGAILTCSKAVTDVKVLHGRVYNVKKPSKETVLTVTENPQAKCCGYLYHATVEDRKVEINISPFRCNCSREPHNDKEWDKLEADESCMEEGTCKALINLHDQWDNLPAENPYLLFWNEDRRGMVQGITMSSMLFCGHGGIITPIISGQYMQELLDAISGLAYKSGELWTVEMIAMAKYVTLKMFMEGYSPDMIAGFVGNIVNEGNFGYFESSKYVTKAKPPYLAHMDNIHNYGAYVSGKYLSDVGTSALVQFRKDGNCSDGLHGFGLGTVQWTYDRAETLIDRYLDKFGDNAFPSREECAEVEINYMLEELRSTYKNVVDKCEKETSGMSDSQKVEKNTEIIMKDYERAGEQNLSKRQEAADIWYNILTGADDEN